MIKRFFIQIFPVIFVLMFIFGACRQSPPKKTPPPAKPQETPSKEISLQKDTLKTEQNLPLTTQSAIPFFYEYAQNNPEKRVRITTDFGSFDIELFEETPYHRANFIFLVKNGYFDDTCFYRVVKNFVIQGGNSDRWDTVKKRRKYGQYLLPPDTKKGFRHHRGTLSMPSSEIDNPHQFASPYEFFIVCQRPGAYHLDGKYTAFGRVVQGMDVVDKINQRPTDAREWPLQNVYMKAQLLD